MTIPQKFDLIRNFFPKNLIASGDPDTPARGLVTHRSKIVKNKTHYVSVD